MKSIQLHTSLRVLNVAFDVGKNMLNWETEVNESTRDGEIVNFTEPIVKLLGQLQRLAKQERYDEVRIICESTGVSHLVSDLDAYRRRLETLSEQMIQSYRGLREYDSTLPEPVPHVLTELMAARIISETGPLKDFASYRQLLRYAGLNLCERSSGVWRGKTKIGRRGRANLRHVLNQWTLSLVCRDRLYAEYYRRKRDDEKMPGSKAMVAVMRKALKMLYGWSLSSEGFDAHRVSNDESRHQQRACHRPLNAQTS